VSGLALGIDAAAHEGALDAGQPTAAVLGCGADVAYPPRNRALHGRVREHGLVVSEYPAGTEPAPWRFPARNRLIAALADVVLVVEARRRSGALITADHALDLGRDVLAVPGWPGFEGAAGVNALLKAGAGLIEDEADLLGWLGLEAGEAAAPAAPDPQSGRVLDALRRGPAHPDQLARVLAMDAGAVSAAIARLELAGMIVRDEAGCWVPLLGAARPDSLACCTEHQKE
jgi:DNA processing protein